MGAQLLSTPELELDTAESKKLADSIREVTRHYNLILDPKHAAIFNLMCCAGGIYGPRAIVVWKRGQNKGPKPVAPIRPEEKKPETEPQFMNTGTEGRSVSTLSPHEIWPEAPGNPTF
jgi:hypothetical protein